MLDTAEAGDRFGASLVARRPRRRDQGRRGHRRARTRASGPSRGAGQVEHPARHRPARSRPPNNQLWGQDTAGVSDTAEANDHLGAVARGRPVGQRRPDRPGGRRAGRGRRHDRRRRRDQRDLRRRDGARLDGPDSCSTRRGGHPGQRRDRRRLRARRSARAAEIRGPASREGYRPPGMPEPLSPALQGGERRGARRRGAAVGRGRPPAARATVRASWPARATRRSGSRTARAASAASSSRG